MTDMFPTLTQFDLHQRLAAMQGCSLMFFSAPKCGACRRLRAVLGEVRRAHPEWRIFEVDAEAEMGLVSEFEVFHLPSMFLFLDGNYHCQLHAEATPEAIARAIRQALSNPAEEAP